MTAVFPITCGGLGKGFPDSSRLNPGAFSSRMCARRQTRGGLLRHFMALPAFFEGEVWALGVSQCRKAFAHRADNGGAYPAPIGQDEIQQSDSLMGYRPLSALLLGYVRSISPWSLYP